MQVNTAPQYGSSKLLVYVDESLQNSTYVEILLMRRFWEVKKSLVEANLVLTSTTKPPEIYQQLSKDTRFFNHLPFGYLLCDPIMIFNTYYSHYAAKTFKFFRVQYQLSRSYDKFVKHHAYLKQALFLQGTKLTMHQPKKINVNPTLRSSPSRDIKNRKHQDQINDILWGGNSPISMPSLPRSYRRIDRSKFGLDHDIPLRMGMNNSFEISNDLLPSPGAIETPKRSPGTLKLPQIKTRSFSTKSSCRSESTSRAVSPIKAGVDNKSYSSKSSEIDLTLRDPDTLEEKIIKPEQNISNLWLLDRYFQEGQRHKYKLIRNNDKINFENLKNKENCIAIKMQERHLNINDEQKQLIMRRFFVVTSDSNIYIYNKPLFFKQTPLQHQNVHEQVAEEQMQQDPNSTGVRDKNFLTVNQVETILKSNNITYRACESIVNELIKQEDAFIQDLVSLMFKSLIGSVKCKNSFEIYQADFLVGAAMDGYQPKLFEIHSCPQLAFRQSAFEFVHIPTMIDDLYDLILDKSPICTHNNLALEFFDRYRQRNKKNRNELKKNLAEAHRLQNAGEDLSTEQKKLLDKERERQTIEKEIMFSKLAKQERWLENLRFLPTEMDTGRVENDFKLYKIIE